MFRETPTVNDFSERQLIARFAKWLGNLNPAWPEGIGDDCAVHAPSTDQKQIITSDALVFGRHFDESISARQAGTKLVNRNLSDIAAMAGKPDRAILNLMFGPDLELEWLKDFFRGLDDAAAPAGLKIVGGDVCRLDPQCFTSVLTIIGTVKIPLFRGHSQTDDAIYVTGNLGGSLSSKHANFKPRLAEGQWLAQCGHCSSLMDLTDGLAKDLPSLLAVGHAAQIDLSAIPISDDGRKAAVQSGRSATEHAFCDGEDYELLFTVRPFADVGDFSAAWAKAFPTVRLSRIGHVVERKSEGPLIHASDGQPLPFIQGFEHFGGS
jgi:thiamine-monophosphate kinase